MTARSPARYLYVTRHGEATDDETELSEKGRRQSVALAHRLRTVPLAAIHHGPLPRARQTAELISGELDDVPLLPSDAAGDFVPYVPDTDELAVDPSGRLAGFLAQFSAEERTAGARLAEQALALFTGPPPSDEHRHELLVTHNFLVGWLVRSALDAPAWRWLSLSHGNGALTVIRYTRGQPSSLLVFNDMSHLSPELCWTGFPAEQRI